MKRLLMLSLLAIIVIGGTGSSKSLRDWGKDHIRVDGYKLKYHREVDLEIELDDLLELESAIGDIEIRGISGTTARLHVEIHEYRPDDIELEFGRDGRLIMISKDDYPGAVGDVYAEVPLGIDLMIETGMGEVDIHDMDGTGFIEIETGMGTVTLQSVANYHMIDVETGKGEIRLGPAQNLDRVNLATGMGGIKVKEADIEDIEVETGMGSIRFLDCKLGFVSGGTGMGSIRFKRTDYEESDINTGFGKVSEDR